MTPASPTPHSQSTRLQFDEAQFKATFPRQPFLLKHALCGHPLFSLESLVELSKRLPPSKVEYNAGTIDIDMHNKLTPQTGLSVEETIRRIETCRSWMVLKNVEADPTYRALLNACLGDVAHLSEPLTPGMRRHEGYIFISSPGSRTPYHMDGEHNFLLQLTGSKTVHMWDSTDRSLLSEQEIEANYTGGHRNLSYQDAFAAKAQVFDLTPGNGLHFPVNAPHWVQNGPEVSVSFSVTFRTPAIDKRALLYAANGRLRGWGLNPTPVGQSSLRDVLLHNTVRGLRKLGSLTRR
jgi:hypothetical protein